MLTRLKVNEAAAHLIGGCSTVKEAAARVGFSDPYHFSQSSRNITEHRQSAFAIPAWEKKDSDRELSQAGDFDPCEGMIRVQS